MGRMQIHEKDEGTFLTYRSNNAQIAGVQLFEPGDLDYDDDWTIFNTNYDVVRQDEGLLGVWSWFDGDVTGDASKWLG